MKNLALSFAVVLLFSRCGDHPHPDEPSVHYTHTPLHEFRDSLVEIPSGTAVRILGFSGDDEDKKKDALHYCQFIVINQATGDTVRVLAAAISLDGGGGADSVPGFMPASIYDGNTGILDATFINPSKEEKAIIRMTPDLHGGGGAAKIKDWDAYGDSSKVKEIVMIPEGVPEFARHYMTVVGVLRFKQQPW